MTYALEDLTKTSTKSESRKFTSLPDLQRWIAQDFKNFLLYSNNCFGFKTGKMQLHLADEIQSGRNKVMIQAFRNSGKTWVVDNYMLFRWHRFINTKILLLSAREGGSTRHLGNIRSIIKNLPALHYLTFARENSTRIWLSNAVTENEASLSLEGLNSAFRGMHTDLVIVDDAEVPSNSATPQLRDKLVNTLSEVEAVLHNPGRWCSNKDNVPTIEQTSSIFVGLPASEFSVYNPPDDDSPHPLRDCHRVLIPAIVNNLSTFPEKFSIQQLYQRKRNMSTPEWNLQYMLDCSLTDQAARVIRFDDLVVKSFDSESFIMAVDPAGETKSPHGDEWGITIGGAIGTELHIREMTGSKGTGPEMALKCLELAKVHKVKRLLIETNFSGYLGLFKEKFTGSGIVIDTIHTQADKLKKLIDTLEPTLNSGRVTFEKDVLTDKANAYELKDLKFSSLPKTDNRIDSLAMLIQYYMAKGFFARSELVKWQRAKIKWS